MEGSLLVRVDVSCVFPLGCGGLGSLMDGIGSTGRDAAACRLFSVVDVTSFEEVSGGGI